MLDPQQINFRNERTLKEFLNQWEGQTLIERAEDLKSCLNLRNVVKSMEKTVASELLKAKDNPEKWLEFYKLHQVLEQKVADFGGKPSQPAKEQLLFDAILSNVVRGVMHEQLDIDPEEDGIDLTAILDAMTPPADYYDEELETDEDYAAALEDATSKDIAKVHSRLASLLSRYNNAYTLKRADYKLEEVKVQTVGFLGSRLFPGLGASTRWMKTKIPCGKGRGDWIDTPTSFLLARTSDLLQETKGRLAVAADERRQEEEKERRREAFVAKIKRVFKIKEKKDKLSRRDGVEPDMS